MSNEPYPGLNPYSEEDAKRFFGRETQIQNIIQRLKASRLTILYGESGVGKTSVVRAGVAAQLRQQAQENLINYEVPVHAVVVFPPFNLSWKDEPLPQLNQQIEQDIRDLAPNIQPPEPELPFIKTLQVWTERLGGEEGDGELFVVLDQFEEYFLYHHSSEPEEGTFALEFPRAVTRSRLRVNFLLSMRKDSLAELDYFKGRLLNLLSNTLELGHLNWDSAREAIKQPIYKYYNKEVSPEEPFDIEEQLIEQVLEEVSRRNNHNGRIEAPYLQLVMESLWKERDTGSRCLRLQTLTELGGAAGIAERHLNEKMELLSENERDIDIAANVFHYLVTPSGGKQAYRAFDLAESANREQRKGDRTELVTEDELNPWLDKLTQKDFRILRPVGKSPNLSYEIFHDVLAQPILAWLAKYLKKKKEEEANRAVRRGIVIGTVIAIAIPALGILVSAPWLLWYIPDVAEKKENLIELEYKVAKAQEDFESGASGQLDALLTAMKQVQSVEDLLNDRSLKFYNWLHPSSEQLGSESILIGKLQNILENIREKNQIQVLKNKDVYSISFSPNGKLLAIGSNDGTVRLWNLQGKTLEEFKGHEGAVLSVSFNPRSPDQQLATASSDGTVRLWNPPDEQPKILRVSQAQVQSVSFRPDGKTLASGSADRTIKLWSLETGKEIRTLQGHSDPVLSVSFRPGGKTLASGSADRTIKLWNLETGKEIRTLQGHSDPVLSVSFRPDGKTLASGSADRTIKLWNLETGKEIRTLQGHSGWVNSVSFSPDGERLATASTDGTARLWNFQGKPLEEFKGHKGTVWGSSFSPDGKRLATASAEGIVRLWDLEEKQGQIPNNLDGLKDRGCNWLNEYLATYPDYKQGLPCINH